VKFWERKQNVFLRLIREEKRTIVNPAHRMVKIKFSRMKERFNMQRVCKGGVVNILGHRLKFKNLIQILVDVTGIDGL